MILWDLVSILRETRQNEFNNVHLINIIHKSISETAALLPAKYLALKQQKPKWDVRENLFFHQKQLKQQSDMITKKKQKNSKFTKGINNLSPFYSENDIDMEGYQSDQPATNLE